MKKTMGLLIGVVALLVIAVPALAIHQIPQRSEPNILTNMVMVNNESTAMANTGMNRLSGSGTLRTGDAYANSANLNTVSIGVVGCCEQTDRPGCCQQRDRRCGCQQTQEPATQTMNMIMVNNQSLATANSGLNTVSGNVQTPRPTRNCRPPMITTGGTLSTGDAQAWSGNDTLVGISVVGLN